MTFDGDLADLMTTTVTYAAPSSMDLHGAQTFTTATVTITARIENESRLVRDATGREVVSMARLYLKPTTSTGGSYTPVLAGQFTLPSGYAPLTPPIIRIQRVDDAISEGGGIHHWEVVV